MSYVRFSLFLACLALIAAPTSAMAQVGHKCVAYCDGDPAPRGGGGGGGGGGRSSVDEGPSPAQISTSLNNEGVARHKAGDHAGAIELYKRALQYNPNNQKARENLAKEQANWANKRGTKAYNAKNFEEAIRLFREAMVYLPTNALLRANLASAQAHMAARDKKWEEAADFFRQELRWRGKRDTWAIANIEHCEANAAYAKGDWALALEKMRKANAASPTDARRDLIKTYEARLAEAKDDAQRQAEEKRAEAEKGQQRAAALVDKAVQDAAARRTPDPNIAGTRGAAGEMYRDDKNMHEYPLPRDPTPAQKQAHEWNNMALFWAGKGDWAEAKRLLNQALVTEPNGPFKSVIEKNLALVEERLKPKPTTVSATPAAPDASAPQTAMPPQTAQPPVAPSRSAPGNAQQQTSPLPRQAAGPEDELKGCQWFPKGEGNMLTTVCNPTGRQLRCLDKDGLDGRPIDVPCR